MKLRLRRVPRPVLKRHDRSVLGGGAVANTVAPDLRAAPITFDAKAFDFAVRQLGPVARGMLPFAELSDEELKAIRHYIRIKAHASVRRSL